MPQQELDRHDGLIKVKMLGGFSIETNGNKVQDVSMRTHQLWHLIEYLITFRHKTIPQEELIEALWPQGSIENPANALKNLVYRVRSTFSSMGIARAREMIVYTRTGYQWNNELRCVVDVEQFDEIYRQATNEDIEAQQRIDLYMKAIELYEGDFLYGSRYEEWVIPISVHYRSLYFKAVYSALELLRARERYADIEAVCKRALNIDQFEENSHKYLMLAMIHQGKQSQALSHYSYVTDLFFRELGVNPPDSIRAVYKDIVRTVHDVELDINAIQEELKEPGDSQGAFYCEYEVFKNLYRLEARTAARTGQAIFISLLTIENERKNEPLDIKLLSRAIDGLYEVIKGSLRKGDVFARFSATQYVLMLPTLTYENCEMVMSRIIKHYHQSLRIKGVVVHAKVQPLNPIEPARR